MDYRQLEDIENYHAGRMSPDESSAFERELSSNPDLKSESDFQGEIIEGLKDYRKSQLKARLDAVDIAPSWLEFAQQSTLMKSFGGVAVASFVGAGVFLYGERDLNTESAEVEIDAPKVESIEYIWDLGFEEPPTLAAKSETVSVVTSTSNEPVTKLVVIAEEDDDSVEDTQEYVPSFDAPDAALVKDEEAFKTDNLDELPEKTESTLEKSDIDVETEITKDVNVKYKYYDGKLFLSGDFNRAPYEILEINSATGRRIYLKYLEKYYKVGITDQLTELPEVKDKSIIEELNLLRKNK